MSPDKPRWLYRFDNYQRAFGLLREAIEITQTRSLSALEKDGIIRRFKYTWELAWKLLKDYLEHNDIMLSPITPLSIVKTACAAKVVDDHETWMQALNAYKKASYAYDPLILENIVDDVRIKYLPAFGLLHARLRKTDTA